jgi:hypothetical protein
MTYPWEKEKSLRDALPWEAPTDVDLLRNWTQSIEETVTALQRDFAFAIKYSSTLVRSSNPDLRMIVNMERGQKLPPGEVTFTDGSTMEFQDIGMPQIGVPTMTVQELAQTAYNKATELGLELV